MTTILNRIRDLDESNSENVKETISAFIQNLAKSTGESHIRWLTTLEDVINRFPKYCFSHRNNIETYLAKFLDSHNCHSVIAAAKCAHLLQQVRPSQEKTATPKTCWREQMNLLCESAHLLIGAIFTNVVDIYNNSDARVFSQDAALANSPLTTALAKICDIQNSDGDSKDKQELLCARLRNIYIFIQAMLVEIYPVAKPIRPQTILDVVVRSITVTSSNLNSLTSYGYTLKIEALRTLEALVLCLRSNLLPFSPLIFRVVIQTLQWTTDNDNEESVKVRIQSYSTLKIWLTILHCGSVGSVQREAKGKCLSEQLVEHFVRDITPKTRSVILTMNAQPTKHLSKKAKRKLANTQLQESSLSAHMPGASGKTHKSDPESVDELATAALECLETFLLVTGIFLKPTTHKGLQSTLVRECHRIHEYSGRRALRLCRALDASRKCVASNTPPPTQHCLLIFSQLVTCHDPELSSFCSKALLDIRLHLHCSPPSLNFVVPETREIEAAPKARNVVSEKNRAALEALLGLDRMPNATPEEIITIPDEPLNKKPRFEDNISISSQSSIEIDDDDDDDDDDNDNDDDDDIEEIKEIVDEPEAIVDDYHYQLLSVIDNHNQSVDINLEDLCDEPLIIEVADRTVSPTVEDNEVNVITEVETIVDTAVPNVHELHTQLPAYLSNDTVDGQESSHSLEIDYDYPNSAKNKVTVLEKLEDENLPSTNETDDIQITCGQLLKSSQEVSQKKVDENKENEPKISNGDLEAKDTNSDLEAKVTNVVTEAKVTNGDVITNYALDCKDNVTDSIPAKNTSNGLSVDDMLADFVDEVNEQV